MSPRTHLSDPGDEPFRSVLDASSTSTLTVGLDGRFLYVNRAFAAATGRASGDFASLRVWDVLERVAADGDIALDDLVERGDLTGERNYRLADGMLRAAAVSSSFLSGTVASHPEIVITLIDLTEPRLTQTLPTGEAVRDLLTGSPGATAFRTDVTAVLGARKDPRAPGALLLVDMEGFKAAGAARGEVLDEIERRVRKAVASRPPMTPVDGDHFALLLADVSEQQALATAQRLRGAITEPLDVGGRELVGTAGIGIVMVGTGLDAPEDLMRAAEAAVAVAKWHGGNQVACYDAEAFARLRVDLELEVDLRGALVRGELELAFEPIVDMRDGTIAGLESLLRWHHPSHGDVDPARFVAMAEHTTLILALGKWTLREVCRSIVSWREHGCEAPPVHVNVSPRELEEEGFVAATLDVLGESAIGPEQIVFEITQASRSELSATMMRGLGELRSLGIRTLLDDFGTGHSSLERLGELPVHGLKIDRSFVRGLPDDPQSQAIVEGVMTMSRALGLQAVAEGVETDPQAAALRSMGCHFAQGLLFSRPLGADRIPGVLGGLSLLGSVGPDDVMSVGEAADALGVSPSTVRRRIAAGTLSATRTAGGHRRVVRTQVERERQQDESGPTMRPLPLPQGSMPRLAAVLEQRREWVRDMALRSVYVDANHGWFGTPLGQDELDRWLATLALTLSSETFAGGIEDAAVLLRAAREGGVPTPERVSMIEGVVQAARAAVDGAPLAGTELRDWLRAGRVLRQLALREDGMTERSGSNPTVTWWQPADSDPAAG